MKEVEAVKSRGHSEAREVVLVVGSSGYLGRSIAERLAPSHTVISTYHRTLSPGAVRYDFFNDDISDLLETFNVNTVIFAAATEKDAGEKEGGNFEASVEHFVRGCKDTRLVYLSSDAVFSGEKGLYSEHDIPSPTTSYGRNLLHFESCIAKTCSDYLIIRPSYIYGFSEGQLDTRLYRTKEVLQRGESFKGFSDMFKSPLGVMQVAEAVITLGLSDFMGVVHVAGERMSVFYFYTQAMNALGMSTEGLRCEPMPGDINLPRDTSLETSLWQQLTGMKPLSVKAALSAHSLRG